MSRLRSLLVCVVVLGLSRGAAADAPWVDLVRAEDGFRVSLPAVARAESTEEDTEVGKIKTNNWSVDSNPTTSFIVSLSIFPAGMEKKWVPASVLAGSQNGALRNVTGVVQTERVITLDGANGAKGLHPGREFFATLPQGLVMRARIYLVGHTLFQIMRVASTGHDSGDEWKRFADSFSLMTPAQPASAPPAPAAPKAH